MKENTQEKSLIEKNKKSIFCKIKNFFKKMFSKKENKVQNVLIQNEMLEKEKSMNFKEYIKRTEDEETKLLELQRKYHNREIDESSLTDEEIDALCELYDKQIEELEKKIEIKEQQLAEYKQKKGTV